MYKVFHLLVPAAAEGTPASAAAAKVAFGADWEQYADELSRLTAVSDGFCYYVRTPRTERGASLESFHGRTYSYEGVDVFGFEGADQACAFRDVARKVECTFLHESSTWLVAREHVLTNGAPLGPLDTGPGIKVITSLRRKPGMDLTAFRRHWLDDHGPYVVATAGISRYIQNHVIDSEYENDEPRYDGLVEVWHRTVADQAACFSDPMMTQVQARDIPGFIDTDTFFSIQCTDAEQWVRGRPDSHSTESS